MFAIILKRVYWKINPIPRKIDLHKSEYSRMNRRENILVQGTDLCNLTGYFADVMLDFPFNCAKICTSTKQGRLTMKKWIEWVPSQCLRVPKNVELVRLRNGKEIKNPGDYFFSPMSDSFRHQEVVAYTLKEGHEDV